MTYRLERVHKDGVDVWTLFLVGHLADVFRDVRYQPKFLDPVHDARAVAQRINEEDRPLGEGLYLREYAFDGGLRDLGGDGEEELASLAELALDPHVSGHERD